MNQHPNSRHKQVPLVGILHWTEIIEPIHITIPTIRTIQPSRASEKVIRWNSVRNCNLTAAPHHGTVSERCQFVVHQVQANSIFALILNEHLGTFRVAFSRVDVCDLGACCLCSSKADIDNKPLPIELLAQLSILLNPVDERSRLYVSHISPHVQIP